MEEQKNTNGQSKKPLNKKFLGLLGVVFAAIIVTIIIISSVDLCNGKKVGDEVHYINDKVNSKSLQYEVTGVSNRKSIGVFGGVYYYSTENNFLVVAVSVTNTSNKNQKFSLEFVSLHRNTYTYKYHESTYFINGRSFAKEISIGASLSNSVYIVFETPTSHTREEYYLYVQGSSSTTLQQILLRTRTGGYGDPTYDEDFGGGYY